MDNLNLYVIIYPLLLLFSIVGITLNKEKLIYKYLVIMLTFISIIRFDTGFDYISYYKLSKYSYIYDAKVLIHYEMLEIGIKKIVDIARYYKEPQFFFAITALITFVLIYYRIYKDSKSPLVSLSFFVFLQMGFYTGNAVVMQACALAICFLSYKFLYNRNLLLYILLIFVATVFFHSSAIICLIIIFVPKKKISFKLWVIYIMSLILFIKIGIDIIIKKYFSEYFYLLNFDNTKLYGERNIQLCTFLLVILIFLKYFNRKFFKEEISGYYIFLENIYILGTIFSVITLYTIGGFLPFRVGIYFMIVLFSLLGEYIFKLKKELKKPVKYLFVLILNIYGFWGVIKRDEVYLNKKQYYLENGELNTQPNSMGIRVFFNKTEKDM